MGCIDPEIEKILLSDRRSFGKHTIMSDSAGMSRRRLLLLLDVGYLRIVNVSVHVVSDPMNRAVSVVPLMSSRTTP